MEPRKEGRLVNLRGLIRSPAGGYLRLESWILGHLLVEMQIVDGVIRGINDFHVVELHHFTSGQRLQFFVAFVVNFFGRFGA